MISTAVVNVLHCVSKNIPDVFSYNSRKHCRTFIIFGKNITEKVRNQKNTTRVSKKTSTHIIGYKLRNSCPILIIFDIKISHII